MSNNTATTGNGDDICLPESGVVTHNGSIVGNINFYVIGASEGSIVLAGNGVTQQYSNFIFDNNAYKIKMQHPWGSRGLEFESQHSDQKDGMSSGMFRLFILNIENSRSLAIKIKRPIGRNAAARRDGLEFESQHRGPKKCFLKKEALLANMIPKLVAIQGVKFREVLIRFVLCLHSIPRRFRCFVYHALCGFHIAALDGSKVVSVECGNGFVLLSVVC